MRVLLSALIWLVPVGAMAQPSSAAPPTGLYDSWSPVRMQPVGALSAPPTALPRWLDVQTSGTTSTITFAPDRRVVWRVRWGPHGPIEKVTLVDGEAHSTSRFDYDARGHLARKRVDGPGISAGPWISSYRTDAQGRVLQRSETLVRRMPWGSRNLPPGSANATWSVAYPGSGAVATWNVDGTDVRRDRFDDQGRLVETVFLGGPQPASLSYSRDRTGRLRRIVRRFAGQRSPARPNAPDPTMDAQRFSSVLFHDTLVERWEVLLLLGAPTTHSDANQGAQRTLSDHYGDDCWLNQSSGFEYDPTGLLITTVTSCICGFCVGAEAELEAEDVLVVDEHWTAGPWIRLDGRVDVTTDHEVVTPEGPRPAGELAVGDVVLDAEGAPLTLRSVERLPSSRRRLGRNLRTRSGVFVAGGIQFLSEQPRSCD